MRPFDHLFLCVLTCPRVLSLSSSGADDRPQCSSVLPSPSDLNQLVAGHLNDGDEWPNPSMRCSAQYWNYRSAASLWANSSSSVDEWEAYAHVRDTLGEAGRCCTMKIQPTEQIRTVFEQKYGAALFQKQRIMYRNKVDSSSLLVQHLCPPSVSHLQNPMALGFHMTRWFNACPGNIFVQYGRRAERSDGRHRTYPFSYQSPFLYNFDWVVAPSSAGARKWKDLGGLQNKNVPNDVVGLYVQRLTPRLIYSVKGPPFLTLLTQKVLPRLSEKDPKVVVYVGGGGLDGTPDGPALAAVASLPVVAAVYAENLDYPLHLRPPNLFNVPLGICMREMVAFAGSFVETVKRAPLFHARHTLLYGCFSGTNYETRAEAIKVMPNAQYSDRYAWCSDRPVSKKSKLRLGSSSSSSSDVWQGDSSFESVPEIGRRQLRKSRRPKRAPAATMGAASPSSGLNESASVGPLCHPSRLAMEDVRARNFWHNASQFKFAYSPFGNGFECYRTFELLALGCIVIMPEYPGAREQYGGLPVAFVTTDPTLQTLHENNLRQEDPPLVKRFGDLTPAVLAEIEKLLGPLAQDSAATRRRLNPAYWHSRIREHLK